jgi:hypothetical protein
VPAAATAFPHRDARFLLKHAVTVGGDADPTGATGWLAGSHELARPYATGGVYPNFPEPGLADSAYHGANTARLRRIRDTYDPDGLFRRGGFS